MPNGSGASEVKAVLNAAGKLASPGDILFNVAHAAQEAFALLDYPSERGAADLLAALLEDVLKEWTEEIDGFVVRQQGESSATQ